MAGCGSSQPKASSTIPRQYTREPCSSAGRQSLALPIPTTGCCCKSMPTTGAGSRRCELTGRECASSPTMSMARRRWSSIITACASKEPSPSRLKARTRLLRRTAMSRRARMPMLLRARMRPHRLRALRAQGRIRHGSPRRSRRRATGSRASCRSRSTTSWKRCSWATGRSGRIGWRPWRFWRSLLPSS